LEILVAGDLSPDFAPDVDDNAVQLVNVLLMTVKPLLLTVVSPVNVMGNLPSMP
jgi:hypothetical protein